MAGHSTPDRAKRVRLEFEIGGQRYVITGSVHWMSSDNTGVYELQFYPTDRQMAERVKREIQR